MVDEVLRRNLATVGALDRAARRLQIAPGRSPQRMQRVLFDRVPGYHPGGSELEQRVFDLLVASGLPVPVRQHKVVVGSNTYYIDLAYPALLIAIEIDGYEHHRERGVFDSDRRRQNDLVRLGWTLLRFTSRSTAEEILADVRDLLFVR